jgi:hypothetical protein
MSSNFIETEIYSRIIQVIFIQNIFKIHNYFNIQLRV